MTTVDLWRWFGIVSGALLILQIAVMKICYHRHFHRIHLHLVGLTVFVIGLIAVASIELFLKLDEPATWRVFTHCFLFAIGQASIALLTVELFLRQRAWK